MRSLRTKLLSSFCLAEVVIIAAIIGVVTTYMRRDTAAQKRFVAETMEGRARDGLQNSLRIMQLLMEEEQRDGLRGVDLVSRSKDAMDAMGRNDLKYLQQFLLAASATAELDLFVLYDLEGTVVASYPPTIDDVASATHFAAWEPGQQLRAKASEDDAWAADSLIGTTVLEPAFLQAHRLQENVGAGAALGFVTLQIVVDSFGDAAGFAVAAKILNGLNTPFERLHQVSGHGAALYLDRTPVAWAGFDTLGTTEGLKTPPLLDPPARADAGRVGEFQNGHLEMEGVPLLAVMTPLADLSGRLIGTLCATVPKAQVRDATDQLGASSDAMLARIRTAILVVGAGALVVFFFTAFVIGSRLINRPLQGVAQGLHDLALGEGDLTRKLPVSSRDEVGQLAQNFNRFIERMRASVLRNRDTAADIRSSVETIQRSSRAVHSGARNQTENLEASHGAALAIGEGAASIEGRTRTLVAATETSSSATQQMGATSQEIAAKMDELFRLVDQVSSSIHQMSSVSGQVSHSVETLSATAQQTAASIAEMDQNIGQVRRSAERTGSVAEEAARDALSGKQAVDATVAGVEALRGMVEESTGVIRTLARRSGEIGGILTTISDVAEQTGLLALNASIIAAQAGRHGSGFGVVANEIKSLATRTKASAKEITGIVHGLQQMAQQAVESTESGRAQVQEEVERAREAGGRLDCILASSEESRSQAAEIASATQEQAEASRQITQAVGQVADMLVQITAAVQQQTDGYRVLAGVSESMRDIASQVKLGTDEQAVGSGQIATAMEHVRTLLEEIDDSTREQTRRSQDVLTSVASALEVARGNAALSADFDAAVATLTCQAETLQQEVGAFKT